VLSRGVAHEEEAADADEINLERENWDRPVVPVVRAIGSR
jgi:hypothetical protein